MDFSDGHCVGSLLFRRIDPCVADNHPSVASSRTTAASTWLLLEALNALEASHPSGMCPEILIRLKESWPLKLILLPIDIPF